MGIPYRYIAIAGNIGSGKTTLAELLAAEYNAKLILEQFADNPFLPKFYEQPDKYALPLEMSFLAQRYQHLKAQLAHPDPLKSLTVSDYDITKSSIFARVTLPEAVYGVYRTIFNRLCSDLIRPELYVYLYRSTENLKRNIRRRGRPYEQSIDAAYLDQINRSYFAFLKSQIGIRILVLDVDNIDFVENADAYLRVKRAFTQSYKLGMNHLKID
ncbi:MAG: deoxynucleoside kinase [Flavobacteriales bacterium]